MLLLDYHNLSHNLVAARSLIAHFQGDRCNGEESKIGRFLARDSDRAAHDREEPVALPVASIRGDRLPRDRVLPQEPREDGGSHLPAAFAP